MTYITIDEKECGEYIMEVEDGSETLPENEKQV